MQYRKSTLAAVAAVAAALTMATPAMAQRWHGGGGHHGWHGGRGFAAGAAGFAAGALIGGALASPYRYGYYGYGPAYAYDPGYVIEDDVYAAGPAGGGSVEYCMQRFRSYDPRSGTYLGYDGVRHPCP